MLLDTRNEQPEIDNDKGNTISYSIKNVKILKGHNKNVQDLNLENYKHC